MFKKKAALPARPPIPSREEILADLEVAQNDDVVFKMSPNKISPTKKGNKTPVSVSSDSDSGEVHDDQGIDLSDPLKAYQKVKTFVEMLEHLEKGFVLLETQRATLQDLEGSLKQDIQKIKQEVSKSGYVLH